MKIRFIVLAAMLAVSVACNQAPGTPAQQGAAAGAPTSQETPPAGTAPATASGGAPSGTPAPGATPGASTATSAASPAKPAAPAMMEMEVPAGTSLEIVLETPVSSATSKPEDAVRGHVARAVAVGGMTTIPEGAAISGTVVAANPSGKVKGLASITLGFNRVVVAKTPYTILTAKIVREAAATKGKDAKKVAIGAGAGAVIGGIAGGGKGAAIGTAVGGGTGAGVVMATKGNEVSLDAGTTVQTTLQAAVKINAPM